MVDDGLLPEEGMVQWVHKFLRKAQKEAREALEHFEPGSGGGEMINSIHHRLSALAFWRSWLEADVPVNVEELGKSIDRIVDDLLSLLTENSENDLLYGQLQTISGPILMARHHVSRLGINSQLPLSVGLRWNTGYPSHPVTAKI